MNIVNFAIPTVSTSNFLAIFVQSKSNAKENSTQRPKTSNHN